MNLDFADVKTIMMGGGVCAIGFGEAKGETKVEDSIERAFNTQLLDIGDIRRAEGALVHIEGGDDMTLDDVNRAGEIVIDRIASQREGLMGRQSQQRHARQHASNRGPSRGGQPIPCRGAQAFRRNSKQKHRSGRSRSSRGDSKRRGEERATTENLRLTAINRESRGKAKSLK
ncbi:MAG: hypothetical protein GTO54_05185, partial [Nitrososphaeria archaeon]|nr:hypothetical protein [Nitrososphaeria archaeon]